MVRLPRVPALTQAFNDPIIESINPLIQSMRSLLSFFLLTIAFRLEGALVLAEKGKSEYRIVIAGNAPPAERYAAEELQSYLEKISGAKLPIITDAERRTSREILLGDNAHTRKMRMMLQFDKLG